MSMFYEYLLNKVADIKGKRDIATWKAGLEKKRCTLILDVTADGVVLKPGLILPRKTPYQLTQRNRLGMKFYGTEKANAWMNWTVIIDWLEDILIPFVGKHPTLLIVDSYSAHFCKEVRDFLNDYKNIHIAIIPGGLTPKLQPLDYSINAMVKRSIKQKIRITK